MVAGALDIVDIVHKLEADTVTDRNRGIDKLRQALSDKESVSQIEALRDNGFHKVLETLFRIVRTDKEGAKKGSATARAKSESRLETAGLALRMVIDVCAFRIKYKTAHAVLDHIVDIILPDSGRDEGLYRPLRNPYLKSLRVLLSHNSHIEHLRPKQLQHLVSFLLDAIAIASGDDGELLAVDPANSIRSSRNRSFRTTQSQASLARGSRSTPGDYLDDLVLALRSLTSISAALLVEQADTLSLTLLSALDNVSRLAQTTFEVLNNLLPTLLNNELSKASRIARQALPYCCRLWEESSPGVREQFLKFLFLSRYALCSDFSWTARIDDEQLELLTKTMTSDHIKRQDREGLGLSDLRFEFPHTEHFFSVAGILPHQSSQIAVANWTSLRLLAFFKATISSRRNQAPVVDDRNGGHTSSKRLKFSEPLQELIEGCSSPELQVRVLNLQLLFFSLSDEHARDLTTMRDLTRLADRIEDAVRGETSWTLLVMGRYVQLLEKDFEHVPEMTRKLWQISSRLLTNQANCNAASFVMLCVLRNASIAGYVSQKLQDDIFSVGVRGPHVLSDATLLLQIACLRSLASSNERTFESFSAQCLRWLDDVWSVPSFTMEDHARTSWLASALRPKLLCQFLLALTHSFGTSPKATITVACSLLHAACLQDESELGFYHFLTGNTSLISQNSHEKQDVLSTPWSDKESRATAQITQFLLSKMTAIQTAYDVAVSRSTLDQAGSSHKARIAYEHSKSVELLTKLCVVANNTIQLLRIDAISSGLQVALVKLWQYVLDVLRTKQGDTFMNMVCTVTSSISKPPILESSTAKENKLGIDLAAGVRDCIKEASDKSLEDDMDLDFLDSTQRSDPRNSQVRSQVANTSSYSEALPLGNLRTRYAQARIHLLQASLTFGKALPSQQNREVYDLIISLTPEELMAVRLVILEHIHSVDLPSRSEAARLLRHVAEICLQQTNLERNENALCFTLRILNAFADLWTDDQDDELGSVAWDIYSWFVNVVLEKREKNIASSVVLLNLSKVLHSMLIHNPRYGADSLPSARTNLLQILRQGLPSLIFEIVPTLAKLFNGYVLTEHPAIFDDIVDQLPTDPDSSEGIAARLFVLASLGEQWPTILRQAVYHIFETVANVPKITELAHRCLAMTCKVLDLSHPKQLLQLYAPQILWTWLQQNTIETMPFRAFGFRTLLEMMCAVESEIVAQLALRPVIEQQRMLADLFNTSWHDLSTKHYARIRAYQIASNTSHKTSQESDNADVWSQDAINGGKEDNSFKAKQCLPDIISIMIVSLRDDKGFEKGLTSTSTPSEIAKAYTLILNYGTSVVQPPARQQPSFRARDFSRTLRKACEAAQTSLRTVWSSALVTHVLRALLDDARSAMGSLHVLSNIRKIKIVICMAGDTLLRGYPLEMLLHNLRPYLTMFHCTEDTIGIFWYLLERARPYLETRLQFLTGIGVMIFVSLSSFMAKPQESTTQESQYRATMSKVEEFRTWLATYFQSLRTRSLSEKQSFSFANLVEQAEGFAGIHSNSSETPTGRFLLRMLRDQIEAQPILDQKSFSLVLRTVADNFTIEHNQKEDILQNVEEKMSLADVLWSSLDKIDSSSNLRAWIVLSLGRIYAVKGPALFSHLHEVELIRTALVQTAGEPRHSHRELLRSVLGTVWNMKPLIASCAEQTLSWLASTMSAEARHVLGSPQCPPSLLDELAFDTAPELPIAFLENDITMDILDCNELSRSGDEWAATLALHLCQTDNSDSILKGLQALLACDHHFARSNIKFIIHILLQEEAERHGDELRQMLTTLFNSALDEERTDVKEHQQIIIDVLVYLRSCAFPAEKSILARNSWLDIDLALASQKALLCKLPQTALLLFEVEMSRDSHSAGRTSRRSSTKNNQQVPVYTTDILRSVSDADFFYGTHEEDGVEAVFKKLKHEGVQIRALAIQSAVFEAELKSKGLDVALLLQGETLVTTLAASNLNALAYATQQFAGVAASTTTFDTSTSILNTHQWDFGADGLDKSPFAAVQDMLQAIAHASNRSIAQQHLDQISLGLSQLVTVQNIHNIRTVLPISGAISEAKDILSADNAEELLETWHELLERVKWAEYADVDMWSTLSMAREANFAAIKRNEALRTDLSLDVQHALLLEISAVRQSLVSASFHAEQQFSLNRALYLQRLGEEAEQVDLLVRTAIDYDLANTLWSQGEVTAPIAILRKLADKKALEEAIIISRTDLLSDLGRKLSDARLSRPDEVTSEYLLPAIKALGTNKHGSKAGKVYHNFANFCDEQLRDTEGKDELDRVSRIRDQKLQEIHDLAEMAKGAEGKTRDLLRQHHSKAKQWYKLDEEELHRLQENRDQLTRRCLESYLLSLQACDDYNRDVIRFLALWLGASETSEANATVHEHIGAVPSFKFAPFVNQLTSRLSANDSIFQKALNKVVYTLCQDHPYHAMYQLFAASKSKVTDVAKNDDIAVARLQAAKDLVKRILDHGTKSASIYRSIHNSNIVFVKFAQEPNGKDVKSGTKVLMKQYKHGETLMQTMKDLSTKIPPPTIHISLRRDKDYGKIPVIDHFEPQIAVAGGVSAPKITAVVSTDGSRHKLLLKGGNDDLRQDAIMEQVFEQASTLLQDYRPTRKRNLGIRTYKVIPLTYNSGIIEFVKDTIPLNDYLLPAHQRYFPKDWKANKCRTTINDAQKKPFAQRLSAYYSVCENFRPVMRFFFMERYMDPDIWFQKRLNYSRTTAAISMLGHVLGLGDRHGHNILLDEQSGEVVHIDLGVAFEMGRVLPIPEVVPFRLTRDLVDGMGFTGVEGPFRRCCNFTLEALRKYQDVIMTILDVLRWDPLYSWSVSPLRLQRMQQNQEQRDAAAKADPEGSDQEMAANGNTTSIPARSATSASAVTAFTSRNHDQRGSEASEADRALAVVAKKLSANLSVEATVNELIRQATDQRNLAVLYSGWAAYA